jgi:hypothetical protein
MCESYQMPLKYNCKGVNGVMGDMYSRATHCSNALRLSLVVLQAVAVWQRNAQVAITQLVEMGPIAKSWACIGVLAETRYAAVSLHERCPCIVNGIGRQSECNSLANGLGGVEQAVHTLLITWPMQDWSLTPCFLHKERLLSALRSR